MSDIGKNALKTKIDNKVYENSSQAITGTIMNEVLQDMVDTLADGGNLDAGSVNTANIADGAITTDKIADGNVKTDKIEDHAVTKDKLEQNVSSDLDWAVASNSYYRNSQAGDVAAKVITTYKNMSLIGGGSLKVTFEQANTADDATLNIDGKGAKPLYYNGKRVSSTNSWEANETVEIYYNNYNSGIYYAKRWMVEPVSVSQNTDTGHTDINIGGDSYPVASVADIDYLAIKLQGYIPNSEPYTWKNLSIGTRYYSIVPINVNGGESYKAKASANGVSQIAFLGAYNPVEDGDANVLSYISIQSNSEVSGILPNGAKYLYVLRQSGVEDRTPQELTISAIDILSTVNNNIFALQKEIITNKEYLDIIKTNITDDILVNSTATITTGHKTLFTGHVGIRKGDLIQLSISGQNVIWSDLRVYINGVYNQSYNVIVNNGKLISPYDIEDLQLIIRNDQIISQGDVTAVLTRYNFNSLVLKECDDINFVQSEIYHGYITLGVWKDVGIGSRLYRIFKIKGLTGQIHVIAGNNACYMYFLSDYLPLENSSVGIISGQVISAGDDTQVEIPNGANYLYILCQSFYNNMMPTTLEIGAINLLKDVTTNLINVYESLKNASPIAGTGILDFNPKSVVVPRLQNLKRPIRPYSDPPTKECLCLLHFSDVHNSGTAMNRLKDFLEEYGNEIDDVIHTGDTFSLDLQQNLDSAWDANWLNVIGNHDATLRIDGQYVIQPPLASYNKLFAPYIGLWNVEQPSGAAENGYCYYYKDYTPGYRLIVVDNFMQGASENNHWNATQKVWFEETLESARVTGLHVIVAIHYPPFNTQKDNNPFESIDFSEGIHVCDPDIPVCVQSFINNGGIFVCWLAGHMHCNFFGVNSTYTGQLSIVAPAASVAASQNYDDEARVAGTKTEDCFDILAFDPIKMTIKMMRIGADYDLYMRRKNTISWNYNTNQLIYVD